MVYQRQLPLGNEEGLDLLWSRLPESSRTELIRLYAQLIAQAARGREPSNRKESRDERKPCRIGAEDQGAAPRS